MAARWRPRRTGSSPAGPRSGGRRSWSTRRGTCARSPTSGAGELELVAEAWQARAAAAREAGFPYVHALVNEGAGAGASLAHSHSQLVWLEQEPPLVAQEREAQSAAGGCLLCRVLAEEREQRIRVVEEREGLILLCPFAGRQPYELLAAPLECESDPFTSALPRRRR